MSAEMGTFPDAEHGCRRLGSRNLAAQIVKSRQGRRARLKPPAQRDLEDGPPPPNRRAQEQDRELIDADRLMMQMVQTSISLIAFGFTIFAFFNGVAYASQTARRLGLALLCLGLAFLALSIFNQRRLRLRIKARYRDMRDAKGEQLPRYSAGPSFALAISLLFVGVWALLSTLWTAIS